MSMTVLQLNHSIELTHKLRFATTTTTTTTTTETFGYFRWKEERFNQAKGEQPISDGNNQGETEKNLSTNVRECQWNDGPRRSINNRTNQESGFH